VRRHEHARAGQPPFALAVVAQACPAQGPSLERLRQVVRHVGLAAQDRLSKNRRQEVVRSISSTAPQRRGEQSSAGAPGPERSAPPSRGHHAQPHPPGDWVGLSLTKLPADASLREPANHGTGKPQSPGRSGWRGRPVLSPKDPCWCDQHEEKTFANSDTSETHGGLNGVGSLRALDQAAAKAPRAASQPDRRGRRNPGEQHRQSKKEGPRSLRRCIELDRAPSRRPVAVRSGPGHHHEQPPLRCRA